MTQTGKLLFAAALALALCGDAAWAQGRLAVPGWQGFVLRGPDGKLDRCVLYNRSVEALNASPYEMLGLTGNRSGIGLLVFYRPGALLRNAAASLILKLDENAPAALTGEVISDFHLAVPPPLPAGVLDQLRGARTPEVTVQGLTLSVELAEVAAVLEALAACVKANAS
jgi:hypothetical protein